MPQTFDPSPRDARTTPISVVMAHERDAVRRALASMLDGEADIVLTANTSTPAEVLWALRTAACHVLLVDHALAAANDFDLLNTVARDHAGVSVVVVGTPADATAGPAMAHVAASVPEDVPPTALLAAIRTGRRIEHVPPTLPLPAAPPRPTGDRATSRLSNRESQVLCLIGRGVRVRDIATELGLSEKTVSTYRTRILEKLSLSTTAQLIRYALVHNLVD
jgi:two-component system invasion response regulator UvrY